MTVLTRIDEQGRRGGAASLLPCLSPATRSTRQLRHKHGRCELRLAEISGCDGMGRKIVRFEDATHSGRVARPPALDGIIPIPSEVANLLKIALVEFQPFCD